MTSAGSYEFLIVLLLAIVVLELVARRLRLPPAAAFILGGLVVALIPAAPSFSIDPNLVLLVFLPPLLMNGGYQTVWAEFRANFVAIALLALGAVCFTTLCVGLVAHALVPDLPWAACFALGAIVSPPDAVAAAAILKRLSLPVRLTATLEGESLLNDASGLVLLKFAVAAALTGAFSAQVAAWSFAGLVTGGVVLGLSAGWIGLAILRRLQDSDLAIIITLLLAPATYFIGERLGVSSVLATVVAGILLGRGQHRVLSAGTRLRAESVWRVVVFVLESVLFILIGLALRGILPRLAHLTGGRDSALWPVGAVVLATIGSRLVWMYGTWLARHGLRAAGVKRMPRPSLSMATVLGWSGMRGVVTLAAALSLPEALAGRDFILASAFAVILVTVLVQGPTLSLLIEWLRLNGDRELAERRESTDYAFARMSAAQYKAVEKLSRQSDGSERHPRLLEQYGRRARLAEEFAADRDAHVGIKQEHHEAVLAAVAAGRAELLRLHGEGRIHDKVLWSLEQDLDLQQLVAEGNRK